MNTPINFRVGEGWDVHALVPGRPLVIGGVTIPHPVGLLGHSDADVLLHAITAPATPLIRAVPCTISCGLQ